VVSKLEDKDDDGLDLSSIEAGALGSLFMLGYMISSPLFAHFAQYIHPLFLMAIGLIVWMGAVIMAGLSRSFLPLAIARSITGVGEASVVCLAPPYIMDNAPAAKKTLWLAVFYSGVPVGYALGFIYGALISSAFGAWWWPFLIEGVAMAPFVVIAIIAYKDPSMIVKKHNKLIPDGGDGEKMSMKEQISILMKTPIYVFLILGYGAYAFTMGGLSYWGPAYLHDFYDSSETVAAYSLGGITVACGLIATFLGSMYMDRKSRPFTQQKERGEITDDDLRAAKTQIGSKILFVVTTVGVIIGVAGAIIAVYILFMITLAGSEFFIFLGTGPVGMVLMSCVPPELRGQANAVAIFTMHLLGDFPSPFIIGVLFDLIGGYWTMILLIAWLGWAAIMWGVCFNLSRWKDQPFWFAIKNTFKRSGKVGVKAEDEVLNFRDSKESTNTKESKDSKI